MDRETVVSSLFVSVSKEKRDRDQNVLQTLRDRQHLHNIFARKAELAMRGKMVQQRLYEAEADVEVEYVGKGHSDISLFEINREFGIQRLQLQQANQWADQVHRDKMSLYGDLEMRNRFFREKIKQKIANNLKNWEEFVAKKQIEQQARIDELSMHQERKPTIVRQLVTQIQDLQNKANNLSDARGFLHFCNSEQVWSDPRSQSTLYYSDSQDHALPRLRIAARYTEYCGNSWKRFWTIVCSRRTNFCSPQQFKEFGIFFSGNTKWPESETRREHQNSSIFVPRLIIKAYWWNLFSRWYD